MRQERADQFRVCKCTSDHCSATPLRAPETVGTVHLGIAPWGASERSRRTHLGIAPLQVRELRHAPTSSGLPLVKVGPGAVSSLALRPDHPRVEKPRGPKVDQSTVVDADQAGIHLQAFPKCGKGFRGTDAMGVLWRPPGGSEDWSQGSAPPKGSANFSLFSMHVHREFVEIVLTLNTYSHCHRPLSWEPSSLRRSPE